MDHVDAPRPARAATRTQAKVAIWLLRGWACLASVHPIPRVPHLPRNSPVVRSDTSRWSREPPLRGEARGRGLSSTCACVCFGASSRQQLERSPAAGEYGAKRSSSAHVRSAWIYAACLHLQARLWCGAEQRRLTWLARWPAAPWRAAWPGSPSLPGCGCAPSAGCPAAAARRARLQAGGARRHGPVVVRRLKFAQKGPTARTGIGRQLSASGQPTSAAGLASGLGRR